MVRLACFALLALSLPALAWGKPPAGAVEKSPANRNFSLADIGSMDADYSARIGVKTDIAPNASFGLGMFGFKAERGQLAPATAREIGTRKTRRAGVGFSFRF